MICKTTSKKRKSELKKKTISIFQTQKQDSCIIMSPKGKLQSLAFVKTHSQTCPQWSSKITAKINS